MDKVERSKCGPDGRVTKLDALDAALHFFRLELLKDDPNNALHTKALRMSETIKSWKATLRKQKTRKRIQRLEELSSESACTEGRKRAIWRKVKKFVVKDGEFFYKRRHWKKGPPESHTSRLPTFPCSGNRRYDQPS